MEHSEPQRSDEPLEAVLFDMDGVLVDSFEAWVQVVEACRARRGLPPLGIETIRESWGQGIQADCETFFVGSEPAALAREYNAEFPRHLGRIRQMDGALDAVRIVRAAGLRTAVVTNTPAELARRILNTAGFDGLFDAFAGGDEVPRGKPDPALLRLAAQRLGTAPSRTVLVGDTPIDIGAARAAGVKSIGYRLDGGDTRIERLAELPPICLEWRARKDSNLRPSAPEADALSS